MTASTLPKNDSMMPLFGGLHMQVTKHTIGPDGAVTLYFDGGKTLEIAANRILQIAQQVEQVAANRKSQTHGEWSFQRVSAPTEYMVGTTDTHKVALVLDPHSPVRTVIAIDPEHALQLSERLSEEARTLTGSQPRSN